MLVASLHQNSMWWNDLTVNLSDSGFWRMKFLKPTSLYVDGDEFVVMTSAASVPIFIISLSFLGWGDDEMVFIRRGGRYEVEIVDGNGTANAVGLLSGDEMILLTRNMFGVLFI